MKQQLMIWALLSVLCIALAGCGSTPLREKPLYPIKRAPGNFTVVFIRYLDDPSRNRSAVSLANDLAKNYYEQGYEVYVVKTKNAALVCLGSFNEREGNEARRTLELAGRLAPATKVQQQIQTPGGDRILKRTLAFKPHVASIDYLKKLEASKPGEAIIKVVKEEMPESREVPQSK